MEQANNVKTNNPSEISEPIPAQRKSDYASYNLRNIYERITPYNILTLSIDALDFVNKTSGAPAPRMKLRFCKLESEQSGNSNPHVDKEISAYITTGKFLVFAHNVLTGVYAAQKRRNHDGNTVYFENYGGTYGDNVSSVRLTLVDGDSPTASFAFLATRSEATINRLGGISPKKGSPLLASIRILMPNDDLKELCLIGKAYIEQYIALDLSERLNAVRKQRAAYNAERYERDH